MSVGRPEWRSSEAVSPRASVVPRTPRPILAWGPPLGGPGPAEAGPDIKANAGLHIMEAPATLRRGSVNRWPRLADRDRELLRQWPHVVVICHCRLVVALTHPVAFDHRHERLNLIVLQGELALRLAIALCPAGDASGFVPFTPPASEVGVTLLGEQLAEILAERLVRSVHAVPHRLRAIAPGVGVDFEPEAIDGTENRIG